MNGYKLPDGYVLTDEEIEKRAEEWENGSWDGHLVELHPGRPRLSDEPLSNLSFKCPHSGAEIIERAARSEGVSKSAFIRDAALERARLVLAASS